MVGADRWRNPDQDLPTDFESRRAEHYGELRKPLDPSVFIDELRAEMTSELAALDDVVGDLEWVEITERKAGAIKFTAQEASPEPRNLRRIKAEVGRRWQVVPLIDMLKEAVLRTGCLQRVTAVTGGGHLHPEVLAERLMLAIYAYGTNTGIRSVAGGDHGHAEEDIRYARRRYLTTETARQIAIEIANGTSSPTTTTRSSSTPPRSAPAPPPPRRSCRASPARPPTPLTRPCWKSGVPSAPPSSPATCANAICNARSKRA